MRQDIILIEFQASGGELKYTRTDIGYDNLINIGLDSGVDLFSAFSFINEKLGSHDSCSYAVVCLNENNCYVVGCYDFQNEVIQLIQNIQESTGYETNFQWAIRFQKIN